MTSLLGKFHKQKHEDDEHYLYKSKNLTSFLFWPNSFVVFPKTS